MSETVRFGFSKTGSLKFISHLDLCRTMRSAMIRAKIPLWYTEGFNPHPRMTFALPLSVGAESDCELMDIKVNAVDDLAEFAGRLDMATSPELHIKCAYLPEVKFSSIVYAEYNISFGSEFGESIDNLFDSPVIMSKRTKKGETDTDISPYIKSFAAVRGDGETLIKAVVSAGTDSYLNPEYIVRALENKLGAERNSVPYGIRRTAVLDENGSIFR